MISNRCHYAIRALLELSLRDGRGPATIGDIAEAQDIPARFLEAILRQMKQGGLVNSLRGKEGGYVLARPPADIHIGEVIRLFEGDLVTPRPETLEGAAADTARALAPVWASVEAKITESLATYDFARLVEDTHRLAFDRASNYSI